MSALTQIFGRLLSCHLLVVVLVCAHCGCTRKPGAEAQRKIDEAHKEQVLRDLAAAHSASTDWGNEFRSRLDVYTVDVRRALRSQPLIGVRCELVDIDEDGAGYVLLLKASWNLPLDSMMFRLTANKAQFDAVTAEHIGSLDEIAVIAKVESVSRYRLSIAAQNEQELFVETTDLPFIAKGVLIDFKAIKLKRDADKKGG